MCALLPPCAFAFWVLQLVPVYISLKEYLESCYSPYIFELKLQRVNLGPCSNSMEVKPTYTWFPLDIISPSFATIIGARKFSFPFLKFVAENIGL